ncbi:hypothetical protein [Halobacterium litoreum]|uniref:Uncharacterized protein n=1 Tax=Halobacterium litoreum TaxID=2039234 RepID=A0ABD5NA44_9EURY|nr:hypothetical protein [Halobacterium litoreum]UHH14819.1 hypothetical protein LT972_07390 [Halobacterium litoreum]
MNAGDAFVRVLDTDHRHDTVTLTVETADGDSFGIQYATAFGESIPPLWNLCYDPPIQEVDWLEERHSGEKFVEYRAETTDSLAAVRIAHQIKQEVGGDDAVFADASTYQRGKPMPAYFEEAGRRFADAAREAWGAVAGAVR